MHIPKCISSGKTSKKHDKLIHFGHFTSKNGAFQNAKMWRKCFYLTDVPSGFQTNKYQNPAIYCNCEGHTMPGITKSMQLSKKISWKWQPCVTPAVCKRVLHDFDQWNKLKHACWGTRTVKLCPKYCQKSSFFTTFEHLSPSNIALTT